MSEFFEMIRDKYLDGKWSAKMLRMLVKGGKITAEEYELITGEKHE